MVAGRDVSTLAGGVGAEERSGVTTASTGSSGASGSGAGCEASSVPILAGGTEEQVAETETKASRISNAEATPCPPHPFGKGPLSFLMEGLYQIVANL